MAPRGRPKQLDGDTRVVSVRLTNIVYENIKARGDDMSTTLREIIEAGISVNENAAAPASSATPAADLAALEIAVKNQRIRRLAVANRELRRQLAGHADAPIDPLEKLSPVARAEFERLVASGGLERLLLKVAEKRAAPTPIDFPMPEIPEVVETPAVEKIED